MSAILKAEGAGNRWTPRSKEEVRRAVLEQRKRLDPRDCAAWDAALLERLKTLSLGREGVLYAYAGVRGEAGTAGILSWYLSQGCRVALPRVKGRSMDFFFITDPDALQPGAFGIPEPGPDAPAADCPDAPLLLPGVAFTPEGGRVGYGGGYYDRFLAREPGHRCIGLAYEFQIFPAVGLETHDCFADTIVTPERILNGRK